MKDYIRKQTQVISAIQFQQTEEFFKELQEFLCNPITVTVEPAGPIRITNLKNAIESGAMPGMITLIHIDRSNGKYAKPNEWIIADEFGEVDVYSDELFREMFEVYNKEEF